jgi:NADPH-dependent curcumin reductase CurA
VIGLGGGPARCTWAVETLGLDACVDYRADDLEARLREAAPDGIDVFSDGAGGALTKLIVSLMNRHGRLFSYGSSSLLYAPRIDVPQRQTIRQMFGLTGEIDAMMAERRIKAECWIVDAFYHERLRAEDDLSRLLLSGALKPVNTVVKGFDRLPEAIVGLYRDGARTGKLQVQFSD